ncbi:MAG: bifunctional folylpolyglutamate synthase/dihydrofolate synthase, partial [Pseudomonadota bacterium]
SPFVATTPITNGHNGYDPEQLAAAAKAVGLNASPTPSFEEAMALVSKRKPERILICGSLYLAGEILAKNGEDPV